MTDTAIPVAAPDERFFSELKQVTVWTDDEIAQVNACRWPKACRVVKIGHISDATVYVLGKTGREEAGADRFFDSGLAGFDLTYSVLRSSYSVAVVV